MNENCATPNPLPFYKRWHNRLMPYIPCDFPDLPVQRDGFVCRVKVQLDLIDRLKVLITGKLEVESRTSTENAIGSHKTETALRVGRWHDL